MNAIMNNALFGIVLTLMCYEGCLYCKKFIKTPLFNPMVIATLLVVVVLSIFNIPYDTYNNGASIFTTLLLPATCILALNIYHQKQLLKKYWIAIFGGCFAGAVTSIISVISLSYIFKLTPELTFSLAPKSITTAIAVDISNSLNGIPTITILAVIITGMIGAMFAPTLIKWFKFDSPISQGCAIGTASHALGTAKAIELGEIQSAIASVSIIVTGIFTVLLALLLK